MLMSNKLRKSDNMGGLPSILSLNKFSKTGARTAGYMHHMTLKVL